MTLKLGMQHQVLEFYQVCSNDDPGWPWPFFTAMSNAPLCVYMGTYFNSRFPRNYWSLWSDSWHIKSTKWVHEDLWVPKVEVIHWPFSKVTQISNISFKYQFDGADQNFEAKFHVEPPWEREAEICSDGPGHMTKIAAMPVYGKNL